VIIINIPTAWLQFWHQRRYSLLPRKQAREELQSPMLFCTLLMVTV